LEGLDERLIEASLRHQLQAMFFLVVELHRALVGAEEVIAGVEDVLEHRVQIVLR
jgi:hypothetical protein